MIKPGSPAPLPSQEDRNVATPELRQRREIGRRLVQVRLPETQESYAQKLDIHVNTLARYERGERLPAADFLRRLAAYGVDLHWLLTGTAQPAAAGRVAELHAVHGVQSYAALHTTRQGQAAPLAEDCFNPSASLFFDEQWLQQHWHISSAETCMVRICGESMAPLLKAGDLVLVDRRVSRCETSGLYLLRMNQQLVVRRVCLKAGAQGEIRAADPSLPVFTFPLDFPRQCEGADVLLRCVAATDGTARQEAGSHRPLTLEPLNEDEAAGQVAWVSVLGRVLWVGQSV